MSDGQSAISDQLHNRELFGLRQKILDVSDALDGQPDGFGDGYGPMSEQLTLGQRVYRLLEALHAIADEGFYKDEGDPVVIARMVLGKETDDDE